MGVSKRTEGGKNLNAEVGMRNAEKQKLGSLEDEKVGAAFSRDNDGGLVIDCNQKKMADNCGNKMDDNLTSDFRIPTSHFKPFRLPTSN